MSCDEERVCKSVGQRGRINSKVDKPYGKEEMEEREEREMRCEERGRRRNANMVKERGKGGERD